MVERRVSRLAASGAMRFLRQGQIGLEKESLRVSPQGRIARTPHPAALGSPLLHPHITTDFSEALLEFVTPPFTDKTRALDFLLDLHAFVYESLGEERLWATSMPCVLEGAPAIPIARYGSSNAGRMKTLYRIGLSHRYGSVMQVIAGVHFNYSVPVDFWPYLQAVERNSDPLDHFRSETYVALVRNLQRFGWIVPYLFGASPAICKSFLLGKPTDMDTFNASTYFYPYATSLRMGDIGYQNSLTEGTGMKACYDSLDAYIRSLTWAIETACPQYEEIGVRVDGEFRQLNANVLQIENEYYSTVRPKQLLEGLEKPTLALRRRGVRYVEIRSLDVNAFHPLGVAEEQLYFLEAFLLFCLLADSPRIKGGERKAIDRNQVLVAHRGRDPALELERDGHAVALRDWARELLDAMIPLIEVLDGGDRTGPYGMSLASQRAKVEAPELTPSARMLQEMRSNNESFFEFAWRMSEGYRDLFARHPLRPETREELKRLAVSTIEQQRAMEAADNQSFEDFLQAYFAQ